MTIAPSQDFMWTVYARNTIGLGIHDAAMNAAWDVYWRYVKQLIPPDGKTRPVSNREIDMFMEWLKCYAAA